MKKLVSLLLALAMLMSLAACGGGNDKPQGGNDKPQGGDDKPSSSAGTPAEDEKADENGDFHANGYTYGAHFHSDEPVNYSVYFNDNAAYPITDSWQGEGGVFDAITKATNVKMDLTIVDNGSYGEKTSLDIAAGTAPYIIPKIYDDSAYVNGGGVVAISDYVKYMPNYSQKFEEFDMAADVATISQADGSYYRLPGIKETCLQDYTLLVRDDIFAAAGYDVKALEKDWTWEEFADILVGVKDYMVSQGMVGANDYIWSDRWCGSESGYGTGGCLLNLISRSYGIYTTWNQASGTNKADLYFDATADEFKVSSTSDTYKRYMGVVEKLVSNKILDPETWSQQDNTADGKFYTGKTALILTNRAQYAAQIDGLTAQLHEGNFSAYRIVIPMGTDDAGNKITDQAERGKIECGLMVSAKALKELGEEEFIKMLRFIDWLWYSDAGLTLTKWGVEGETYTVDADGNYALLPQYYCGGLSIAQTSDDQEDMRLKYGYACGNYMYSGSTKLLTSNFSADLREFYDRMAAYRTTANLDPAVAFSEDDADQMNLWLTPLWGEMNKWTQRFAMGQASVSSNWDEYVAALNGQNLQSVVDMYNSLYKG